MTIDDVIKRFDELGCLFKVEGIGKYQHDFIPFAQDKGLIRWLYWEIGCMNCYQCMLCNAEPKTAWGGVLRHFKKYHPEKIEELIEEVKKKLEVKNDTDNNGKKNHIGKR